MAHETLIPFTGVIATEPQLRWTTGDKPAPVLSFLVVSDSTRYDPKAGERGEWVKRNSTSLYVSLWRNPEQAEQVLRTGMAVIIHGELWTEPIEKETGDGRTETEYRTRFEAQHIGPDLTARTQATRAFWERITSM